MHKNIQSETLPESTVSYNSVCYPPTPLTETTYSLSSLFPDLTPPDSNTCSSFTLPYNQGVNTSHLQSPPSSHPSLALILPNQHRPPTITSKNKGKRTNTQCSCLLWGLPQEARYLIIICSYVWHQTRLSSATGLKTDMHSACIFPTHVHRTLIVYIISSSHANNTSKEELVSSFHKSLV